MTQIVPLATLVLSDHGTSGMEHGVAAGYDRRDELLAAASHPGG